MLGEMVIQSFLKAEIGAAGDTRPNAQQADFRGNLRPNLCAAPNARLGKKLEIIRFSKLNLFHFK